MMTVTAAEKNKQKTNSLCCLFLIFLIGCLMGWVYEEIFDWITEGVLRNRGILYGPWLPIYGIGALGIYAMKPVKKHPVCCSSAVPWWQESWSTSSVTSASGTLGCGSGTTGNCFGTSTGSSAFAAW